MPSYDYACVSCKSSVEMFHSIKETPEVACDKCGKLMERLISPPQFVIRGTTSSKLWQEERWRNKKNAALEIKQMERYGGGQKLIPNIGGTEFENWKDARSAAAEARIPIETYDNYVNIEKRSNNSGRVDENRWKRAKENKAKA